jgi:hypothetical protein
LKITKQEAFGKSTFLKFLPQGNFIELLKQGAGGEFQPHIEGKQKHGKDTCTPTIKKQIELGKQFFHSLS